MSSFFTADFVALVIRVGTPLMFCSMSAYVAALAKEPGVPVPYGLAGLDQKPVRHTGVVDAAAMSEAVLEALK